MKAIQTKHVQSNCPVSVTLLSCNAACIHSAILYHTSFCSNYNCMVNNCMYIFNLRCVEFAVLHCTHHCACKQIQCLVQLHGYHIELGHVGIVESLNILKSSISDVVNVGWCMHQQRGVALKLYGRNRACFSWCWSWYRCCICSSQTQNCNQPKEKVMIHSGSVTQIKIWSTLL